MIEFSANASQRVRMLDQDGKMMLNLMHHLDNVPGAIAHEDLSHVLNDLRSGIEKKSDDYQEQQLRNEEISEQDVVSLQARAFPLIELIKNAIKKKQALMWTDC